jgi:hypothetical protein
MIAKMKKENIHIGWPIGATDGVGENKKCFQVKVPFEKQASDAQEDKIGSKQ